jgi:hypothetical protein
MVRGLLLAFAVVLALGGCGGNDEARPPDQDASTATTEASTATTEPTSSRGKSVLAGRSAGAQSEIFWADPLTLEPVDSYAVPIPFFYSVAELAPEGDLAAVGGSEQGVSRAPSLGAAGLAARLPRRPAVPGRRSRPDDGHAPLVERARRHDGGVLAGR